MPPGQQALWHPLRVARFLLGVLRKVPTGFVVRRAWVNGRPGIAGYENGRPAAVLMLEVADGRIRAIRIVVNPDKLRAIPALS